MTRHLAALLSLSLVVSCKTVQRGDATLSSEATQGGSPQQIEDNPAWTAYVQKQSAAYPQQPACQPASFAHQGPQRGMIILFHGFTACPQQFFDLADGLAKLGWDVYLPTNPGHGMVRNLETREDSLLPDQADYAGRLGEFVKTANEIARASTASVKIVGGLSLGGALATAAVVEDPALYQRALVMTPFYAMLKPFSFFLGAVKNADDVSQALVPEFGRNASRQVLDTSVGWGPNCEKEAEGGRQGICLFRVKHLVGSQQFGYELSQNKTIRGKLQFIGVENDLAIDNDRLIWFYKNRVESKSSQTDICFFPKGSSHSLVSKFDNPQEDKFWLADFTRSFYAFVEQGVFFAKSTKTYKGFPQCLVKARNG